MSHFSRRTFLQASSALLLGGGMVARTHVLFADDQTGALEITQLTNKTHSQMMSYILRSKNGKVLVVDGGTPGDREYLLEVLRTKLAPGQKISAWFLTHCHLDHFGAFSTLLNEQRLPAVEKIYFAFPPEEWLKQYEPGEKKHTDLFFDALRNHPLSNQETPRAGQKIVVDNLTVTVLNDFDLNLHANAINNSTMIFRVDAQEGPSMLFLGDLGFERGEALRKTLPPELLRADAVQMAHHGQNGVSKEFYAAVAPKECFWPTPDWLWENDPGSGPNTGPWKTLQVRAWCQELGITVHHVSKDSTQTVTK